MKIIDISVPLGPCIPVWPGSPEFVLHRYKRLSAGDVCNNSIFECDVHMGTHVDAPAHFLANGDTVEKLSLEVLIGPAVVSYLPKINTITANDLESLTLSPDTRRLLLRTRNSGLWANQDSGFRKDYVALTPDAAHWMVEKKIALVGIDYLSVAGFDDTVETHRILLQAGIVVLEGLNLDGVEARTYELICLPLKLVGAEGAPVRAVLRG
jgi:arylformamidase